MKPPRFDGRCWKTEIHLPAFRAAMEDSEIPVCVELMSEAPAPSEAPPSSERLQTLSYLYESQSELFEVVFRAIRRYYDEVRPKYVRFALEFPSFMGDPEVSMPADPDLEQLARLHRLDGIFVHEVVREGLAYVGLSFNASWEPEHGVGVLLLGRRVVDVGFADVSFIEWMAKRDRDG
jgi:hypothetical protein